MGSLIYVFSAIFLGAAVSLQPPVNAVMARELGSPLLASTISMTISLFFVSIFWLVWNKDSVDLSQIRFLPWWVVIGGVVGVVFVVGSLVVAPVIGVALFFVCLVTGQLVGSTLIDQFGMFGLPEKPLNMMKIFGLIFVLIGAFLVQKSRF